MKAQTLSMEMYCRPNDVMSRIGLCFIVPQNSYGFSTTAASVDLVSNNSFLAFHRDTINHLALEPGDSSVFVACQLSASERLPAPNNWCAGAAVNSAVV